MTSFIEEARRRQIVDAAIRVLAREGYAKAPFSCIKAEAQISKSTIMYHFCGGGHSCAGRSICLIDFWSRGNKKS
ncbi:TetR/AcrR family transcriptional regulator [Roseinatronobacter alkalisoli]|uniref:TetR/AcrR family transcriptional regulator n=1 Tax=Roseinatronobacter alkalisoli TaxID=3028235 RepID=UPI003B66FE5A